MKKHIILEGRRVGYTLRKSHRARRMRLAVYYNGSVVVTTPCGVQETVAERFIREKTQWLLNKIALSLQFKRRPIARYSRAEYLRHKEAAYALALERVAHFNKTYKFRLNTVNIRNQKTRWGSCSKKGNLNFNYKIALLPKRLADYIIVHEICHLEEFNHSLKFWNLVAKTMPDYRGMKDELKRSGVELSSM